MSDAERIQQLEAQLRNTEERLSTCRATMQAAHDESCKLKAELVRADKYERELSEEIGDLRCSIRSAWDEINRLQRMEVAA